MGKELLEGGAPSVHIYTLNLETTAMAIVDGLNLAPKTHQAQKVSSLSSLRSEVNSELNFSPNFEGLVLGCIDADFCK